MRGHRARQRREAGGKREGEREREREGGLLPPGGAGGSQLARRGVEKGAGVREQQPRACTVATCGGCLRQQVPCGHGLLLLAVDPLHHLQQGGLLALQHLKLVPQLLHLGPAFRCSHLPGQRVRAAPGRLQAPPGLLVLPEHLGLRRVAQLPQVGLQLQDRLVPLLDPPVGLQRNLVKLVLKGGHLLLLLLLAAAQLRVLLLLLLRLRLSPALELLEVPSHHLLQLRVGDQQRVVINHAVSLFLHPILVPGRGLEQRDADARVGQVLARAVHGVPEPLRHPAPRIATPRLRRLQREPGLVYPRPAHVRHLPQRDGKLAHGPVGGRGLPPLVQEDADGDDVLHAGRHAGRALGRHRDVDLRRAVVRGHAVVGLVLRVLDVVDAMQEQQHVPSLALLPPQDPHGGGPPGARPGPRA
mmetsp:Transcript_85062/g.225392  ORF Transcript_85062/g.225392 Transcript_85062/m.225392 type:complete len:414 (-) Transcript_85062:3-1244(-)